MNASVDQSKKQKDIFLFQGSRSNDHGKHDREVDVGRDDVHSSGEEESNVGWIFSRRQSVGLRFAFTDFTDCPRRRGH